MRSFTRPLAVAAGMVLAAVAALAPPPAEAARVGIGIGIGVPFGGSYGPGYYGPGYPDPYGYYYGPRYIYPAPPTVVVQAPPQAAAPPPPEPIFYPKDGQSPAQVEGDRQACNRWATTQPSALADASVFQRATYACMEGRGYTVR